MADAAAFSARFNPETPVVNQKRSLYSGISKPAAPGDSKSKFQRCGDDPNALRTLRACQASRLMLSRLLWDGSIRWSL